METLLWCAMAFSHDRKDNIKVLDICDTTVDSTQCGPPCYGLRLFGWKYSFNFLLWTAEWDNNGEQLLCLIV